MTCIDGTREHKSVKDMEGGEGCNKHITTHITIMYCMLYFTTLNCKLYNLIHIKIHLVTIKNKVMYIED